MDIRYRMQGGIPLQGEVTISGSKNALLPMLAAALLTDEETVLENVPSLRDVYVMLEILEYLGVQTKFENGTVTLKPTSLRSRPIPARC